MTQTIINQVFRANELRFCTQLEKFKEAISGFLDDQPLTDAEVRHWSEKAFITYMQQHVATLEQELSALNETNEILKG